MSSPAPFDWRSLIGPGINLGMKAVGDIVMPEASVQNARTNSRNSELDRELARAKYGNAQNIRQAMLPGMFTQSGYAPAQGRQMAAGYSSAAPASLPSGGSSQGPGLGSQIAKGAATVGMGLAPAALGSLFSKAAPAMTRQAIQTGAPVIAGSLPAAGHGVLGAIGGLATNPVTLIGAGALAAGLIWKHTQAHPTADKWVQGVQAPFDNHMRQLQSQGLPPDQLKQSQMQSAQNYLSTLAQFAQQGGHNMEVAQNAARTFRQYYGDPMKYGIQLPF